MSDNWQEYVNDPRTVCKYGTNCYQKNPDHHKNFKHPPLMRKQANRNKGRYSPYTKNIGKKSPIPTDKNIDGNDKVETEDGDSKKTEENTDNVCKTIKLPEEIKFYDKNTDASVFKDLFLVEMPTDFFKFYDFINECGDSMEKTLADVHLELIGPYDLLLGKLPVLDDKELYLVHWRFFYDPPEFQAVLKKKKSEYHIGYFRDSPEQKPIFLASSDSANGYQINVMSENIFGAVYLYLQNEKKKSPFNAVPCQKLSDKIKAYAEENSISLEEYTMKKRQSHIQTRSLHGAGIVVPFNKQTYCGYRRLVETDANLKKMFTNLQNAKSDEEKDKILSDLQVVVTNASIALDEYDFGTGLELGIDFFCSGLKQLESIALSNLTASYTLLNRKPFAQIAEAHMKYRRKGANMSLLN